MTRTYQHEGRTLIDCPRCEQAVASQRGAPIRPLFRRMASRRSWRRSQAR